jgi:hypothetical protein
LKIGSWGRYSGLRGRNNKDDAENCIIRKINDFYFPQNIIRLIKSRGTYEAEEKCIQGFGGET